ncbi:hypothetical protein Tco_0424328, partial [Tanacetum coccineum]
HFDAMEPVGFDKAKVECYNFHKTEHFARECRSNGNQDSRRRDAWNTRNKAKDNERRFGKQEEPKDLVTLDGDGVDWTSHSEDEQENYALMVFSNSGSDMRQLLVQKSMRARDKAGLGYGDQMNKGVLSYEHEVFGSLFYSWSSDIEDSPVNDRYAEGMHIYESDSDDDCVTTTSKEQEQPSFAFVNTAKHVKTPRQTVKEQNTCSQSPKPDKKDCSGLMSKKLGLGYGFTKKACFVCGSFSHLIRDCDFHEKRMAKQAELNKRMCKGTGQRENRPVWNNVQRVNHQNQFVPTAVLTRTGRIQVNTARASSTNNVNTARHNFNSQAVPTNATRKVNTVKPIVNNVRPKTVFHKTYSPIRRPFNRTTAQRTKFSNQKVNTAEVKAVSAVGGKRETAVKPSAGCNWRPKRHYWNKDYPQRDLKNKGIIDSGCSRAHGLETHRPYLAEYQDYNGGLVGFEGSKGYITGKGKIKTGKLNFEDVCFVKELQHFNLFSVSQMCDKKNKVLFTDTECLVLSPDFKLPDENQVLLRVPRQNNMYSFNLKNIVPSGGLACLITKAKFQPREHCFFWRFQPKEHSISFLYHRCVTRRTSLFDYKGLTVDDTLTYGIGGLPVRSENQANKHAGPKEANHSACTQDNINAGNSEMEVESAQDYFVLPIWSSYTSTVKSSEAKNEGEKPTKNTDLKTNEKPIDQEDQAFLDELKRLKRQEKEANDAAEALRKDFAQDTKDLLLQAGAASTPVSTASPSGGLSFTDLTNTDQDDSQIPALEDIYDNPNDGIFTNASYDDEGAVADFTNLETIVNVSPIPTSRIHSIHPSTQILGDPKLAVQTRSKVNKSSGAHAFVSYIQKQRRNNHKDFQHCLFVCFLSQIEHKKISDALEDESWVDAIQEELLQFKIQKVWILVDLPYGKKAIRTK